MDDLLSNLDGNDMDILSLDWDYFFPNMAEYDWSMTENKWIFYEMIWHIRWSNKGVKNRLPASSHVLPDSICMHYFWSKTLINTDNPKIVITDSHADIVHFLDIGCTIWNYDQHHDCGYRKTAWTDKTDCSNWGLDENVTNFNQIYPEWRLNHPENDIMRKAVTYYGHPPKMPKFDLIFVCRSSCWCPSWCDPEWALFLSQLEKIRPEQYKNAIKLDYVLKQRPFNMDAAKQFGGQYDKSFAKDQREDHKIR